ncbi:MAG: hypothetical protein ACUVYA_11295 [Planctomycetota bacterium]
MGSVRRVSFLTWASALFVGFLSADALHAQGPRWGGHGGDGTDGDGTSPVRVYGSLELVPPEGAEEDATGRVNVLQVGERMALHVYVRHLDPGATYAVTATCPPTEEGAEPTVDDLGTITTRPDVVPPPYCFLAKLAPPEPAEPQPPEGEAGWFRWIPRPRPTRPPAGGMAVFHRNRDATELSYKLGVWGVSGDLAATLVLSAEKSYPLPANDDGRIAGRIPLAQGDLEALASGDAKVVVTQTETAEDETTTTVEVLSGTVKVCCPWFEKLRAHFAKVRAGTGALRLDTANEDSMPCGVAEARALAGVTISVSGPLTEEGEPPVALAGTFTEESFHECRPPTPEEPGQEEPGGEEPGEGDGTDPGTGDGASLAAEAEALSLLEEDAFFEIPEVHDASFVRGDLSGDGRVDIGDAISSLNFLFRGGPGAYCADAADADDSGAVDIADPVFTLIALFQGGRPLPAPWPSRGFDPTPDGLFCSE